MKKFLKLCLRLSGWSPFDGYEFKGTPVSTIINGQIKMRDGKILGDPGGKPLKF